MRRFLKAFVAFSMVVGGIAYLATHDLARSQTTQLNPTVTSASVTSTSALIIGANPSRRGIRICNISVAGVGTSVWIWPGPLTPVASDYLLPVMATGGPPTCYVPPAGVNGGPGNIPVTNQFNANGTSVLSIEEW